MLAGCSDGRVVRNKERWEMVGDLNNNNNEWSLDKAEREGKGTSPRSGPDFSKFRNSTLLRLSLTQFFNTIQPSFFSLRWLIGISITRWWPIVTVNIAPLPPLVLN